MLKFSKSEIATAVEIGTSKVCVLIGAYDEHDVITVLGHGEMPVGDGVVMKGVIQEVDTITELFRGALEVAEETAEIQIGQENVFFGISGPHIRSYMGTGIVAVNGPDNKVIPSDIAEACASASIEQRTDEITLDSIVNRYILDGKRECGDPLNQTAFKLDIHSHNICCDRNILGTFQTPLNEVGFERAIPIFNGIASASVAVTEEEHEKGVVFIDIGAGTTEYLLLFSPGVLASGVIPVGTDHVMSDLSVAFDLPISPTCRELLLKFSSDDKDVKSERVLEVATSQGPRKISIDNIEKVIELRMRETFEVVRDNLAATGALESYGNSVVITGGGASLAMAENLAAAVFACAARVAGNTVPENFNGVLTNLENPRYSTLLGLLKYGLMRTKQPSAISRFDRSLTSWMKKAYRNIVNAVKI